MEPKANDPNSVMPKFGFTKEQARQVLTYLLSLREEEFNLPFAGLWVGDGVNFKRCPFVVYNIWCPSTSVDDAA